jgi:Protein of unknown function (DUF1573)
MPMSLLGERWRTGAAWLAASAVLAALAVLGVWAYANPMHRWRGWRPSRPAISLSSLEVNFGRLRPFENVERAVTIENRGGGTLLLEVPTATCGCQKPLLGKTSLGPGDRAELLLRQQAGKDNGPFTHMVFLKSNDPVTPEAAIYLFGEVTRGLVVRPEPLVFEAVRPGETRTRWLEVYSDDGTPFRLLHQETSGPLRVRSLLNQSATLHRIEVAL